MVKCYYPIITITGNHSRQGCIFFALARGSGPSDVEVPYG